MLLTLRKLLLEIFNFIQQKSPTSVSDEIPFSGVHPSADVTDFQRNLLSEALKYAI